MQHVNETKLDADIKLLICFCLHNKQLYVPKMSECPSSVGLYTVLWRKYKDRWHLNVGMPQTVTVIYRFTWNISQIFQKSNLPETDITSGSQTLTQAELRAAQNYLDTILSLTWFSCCFRRRWWQQMCLRQKAHICDLLSLQYCR